MTTYIEGQRVATLYTGNTLYVNTESGDDVLNNGESSGAPLATIQAAIDRFLPPYLSPQTWDTTITKRIIVQHTPGMAAIRENIIKPAHIGPGLLVIEGEEWEAYSVTQSGAAAAVDGYESLWQIDFTGASLPAGLDGYFIAAADDVVFNNEIFTYLDSFVIAQNYSNTVLVPAVNIGVSDGFGFGDTNSLRVLYPQVIWRDVAPSGSTFGPYSPQITNLGGPLQIKGFRFSPDSTYSVLFNDKSGSDGVTFETGTHVVRCMFDTDSVGVGGYYLADGSASIHFDACKFQTTGSRPISFRSIRRAIVQRCFFGLNGNLVPFSDIGRLTFTNNFVLEETPSSSNHLGLSDIGGGGGVTNCDFRDGPELLCNKTTASFPLANLTFEGCTSNCIELTGPGHFTLSNISSANCIGYGVIMLDGAEITDIYAGVTVTASLGDIKVGDAPVADWADLPVLDLTTGCRARSS